MGTPPESPPYYKINLLPAERRAHTGPEAMCRRCRLAPPELLREVRGRDVGRQSEHQGELEFRGRVGEFVHAILSGPEEHAAEQNQTTQMHMGV